ncbi:MAG: YHYH protein [Saprospiraceae bacterium]|jgi:hypothetical protein|tara:strand:+ start:1438 stop:2808 length:1371 start_codon:yes stop_codon:yes gene_type:complete
MKNNLLFCVPLYLIVIQLSAQTDPNITSWLQNTTETGSYYISGNSTAIDNDLLYNCQHIEYSDDFVYVHTKGIPAYPTGPFNDGNPSQASDQNAIYKMPRTPQPAATPQNTNGGNIGIFINGVSLFDYRDGVGWNANNQSLCGGPGNPPCPGGPMAQTDWTRDAIPAEKLGFDCSKAHPAMGNYHHHQNPSAFKLDIEVVSDICNLYDAEGLYAIDVDKHSPLIGYAYDGYPIYGAYGFQNKNGSGGIARIKSGYQLRDITERNTHADGSSVDNGPDIGGDYFLGYFREDYEWIAHEGEDDYLDVHNGRFSITPEYPNGIYAYFATVDDNWNSTYPYVVGPTFYGVKENRKVNAVTEDTEVYDATVTVSDLEFQQLEINIYPNPTVDLIAIQITGLISDDYKIDLIDMNGKLVATTRITIGSTLAYFDVETLYSGNYMIVISNGSNVRSEKVVIGK